MKEFFKNFGIGIAVIVYFFFAFIACLMFTDMLMNKFASIITAFLLSAYTVVEIFRAYKDYKKEQKENKN